MGLVTSILQRSRATRSGEVEADWSRESKAFWSWCPSRSLIASIRAYQRGNFVTRRVAVARHTFWSAVTGADIPVNANLGGGLLLPHPNGVVIHPHAVIGPNCTIFQQVTIGTGRGPGVPTLGTGVDVGCGAKILGPVRIREGGRIRANAVITRDVL